MEINSITGSVLPKDFFDFLVCIDSDGSLGRLQQTFIKKREDRLDFARHGHFIPYESLKTAKSRSDWQADLKPWLSDQRNQMTGPADDDKLVKKLINSGSPGVMLDLEDSIANTPRNLMRGHRNVKRALEAHAANFDSKTTIFTRVRGLHMGQKIDDSYMSASLFDLVFHFYDMNLDKLSHPPLIYIPKSESAEEALWWKSAFSKIENTKGWEEGTIKCMALVEAMPLAFEIEEFSYYLQPYLVGLNLGRWDYMASLIDHMYNQPDWLFPDRNRIPTDVPFFQNLRLWMAHICHKHGMLAIGGMSALYPNRRNKKLNSVAQSKLKIDKENEAACFMDGAWTGHPDQNEIAVAAFPEPNQIYQVPKFSSRPNLLEFNNTYEISEEGTREAIRTCIRYRDGVLRGKGASLIDGYMEDLATDRIYRIIISQRVDRGFHSMDKLQSLFVDELYSLNLEYDIDFNAGAEETLRLIKTKQFNPR